MSGLSSSDRQSRKICLGAVPAFKKSRDKHVCIDDDRVDHVTVIAFMLSNIN